VSLCPETLTKIEPAQVTPVTVAEVLRHLHLDGATEHEDDLTDILRDAIDYVEAETDLALCVAKWRWTLDYFPCAWLRLPIRPVLDASIRYRDTAGNWQTVNPTTYRLDGLADPPVLRLNPLGTWPSTYPDSWATVEITLTAGHNGLDQVPSQAKRAILLLAGHWFANREAAADKKVDEVTAFAVANLLGQIAGREVV
jgi:uncharacterized phiE125 gp8 family phage protein